MIKLKTVLRLAIFLLCYTIYQKNRTLALVIGALYFFYLYLKRQRSASRILAIQLTSFNRAFSQFASSMVYVKKISQELEKQRKRGEGHETLEDQYSDEPSEVMALEHDHFH